MREEIKELVTQLKNENYTIKYTSDYTNNIHTGSDTKLAIIIDTPIDSINMQEKIYKSYLEVRFLNVL